MDNLVSQPSLDPVKDYSGYALRDQDFDGKFYRTKSLFIVKRQKLSIFANLVV